MEKDQKSEWFHFNDSSTFGSKIEESHLQGENIEDISKKQVRSEIKDAKKEEVKMMKKVE